MFDSFHMCFGSVIRRVRRSPKTLYFPLRKSSFVWCAQCFWFKCLNMFFFLSLLFFSSLFFWIWRQVFSFAMGTTLCSACLRIFTWRFRPILFFFLFTVFFSLFVRSHLQQRYIHSIVIWFSWNADTRTQNNRRKENQLLWWHCVCECVRKKCSVLVAGIQHCIALCVMDIIKWFRFLCDGSFMRHSFDCHCE